jgi:hypothetical protein
VSLLAAALVFVVACLTRTADAPGVFWDDGVYLVSARALALGEGYVLPHLPGAPAAVHFPPGFPALLAVVWRLWPSYPDNLVLLKLVNPLLLALATWLAVRYATRTLGVPARVAAAVAVLFAASLPLLVLANVLFSEPLFLCAVLATLAAAEGREDPGMRRALVTGALAGAATLVRTLGLALVPGVMLALWLRGRRREACVAGAASLALIVPWSAWSAAHLDTLAAPLRGSYGPYLDWALALYRSHGAPLVARILTTNLGALFRSAGVALFPWGPIAIRPLLLVLVVLTIGVGALAVRRRAPALLLFAALYALLVLAWPYQPERFLWAVWPLVGLLLARGAVECWRVGGDPLATAGVRASTALLCAVALVASVGVGGYTARGASRGWFRSASTRNAMALAPVVDWVRTHTAPTDIVACDGEPYVHLQTGRTVVPVHVLSPDEYLAGTPLDQAADDLRALIRTGRPRFLVLSGGTAELAAAPLLDGAGGTPALVPLDTLPGGGAAYRVVLP